MVGTQVQKYTKTVYQLDKGLPPNGVVPTLKFKVEAMKDMVLIILYTQYYYVSVRSIIFQLPVMTDLRNPSLKSRHWSLIEEVIGHKFDPDIPLTLTFLHELEVFNFAEAIQEISGQASSEASLEAILKKVEVYADMHTKCTLTKLYYKTTDCTCYTKTAIILWVWLIRSCIKFFR